MIGNSEEESKYNQDDNEHHNYRISDSDNDHDKCKLDVFSRVRYFTGQLLVPEDFLQEQIYNNDKRHLLNRLVNGTGIVCGLNLQILDQSSEHLQIRISSGLAIDCCGKEIIVKNDKNHSLKTKILTDDSPKRIGLFLTRKDIPNSLVPIHLINSPSGGRLSESRIEESYKLVLKLIEESPVKIQFDKTSYCTDDKVRIEVWDPDNTIINGEKGMKAKGGARGQGQGNGDRGLVELNISSNKDPNGIPVSLYKLKNRKDTYRGEITLSRSGESAANKIIVFDHDNIKAKFNANIFAKAFVYSPKYSFLLNEKKIMNNYCQDKLLQCDEKETEIPKAPDFKDHEHGVLLAILKIKANSEYQGTQSLDIDHDETDMLKDVVYNNPLLYDLVNESKTYFEEDTKLTKTTVLSGTHEIKIVKLKPNCYIITNPIEIFDKNDPLYRNKSLEFPPVIYVGRTTYDNPDQVMYFEDFEYDIVINTNRYNPNTPEDKQLTKDIKLNLMQSITFKPLDITSNSFRLIITKDYQTADRTEELFVRWWALCNFKDE